MLRARVLAALLALLALSAPAAAAAPRPAATVAGVTVSGTTADVSGTVRTAARARWHVAARRVGSSAWSSTPRRSARGRRPVRTVVTGLRPGARYDVRLVATTCAGCARGTARSATRRIAVPAVAVAPRQSAPPVAAAASAVPPEPQAAAPPPAALVEGPSPFSDPVFAGDFPDPMVLRDGAHWYAYSTGERFPVMRSSDLVHWTPLGRALLVRPSWAVDDAQSHPWAPSVLPVERSCTVVPSERCFLLFHTSLSDRHDPVTNCVGLAESPTAAGPFTELGILERDGAAPGSMPIGCGDDAGFGQIDAAPFVDDDGKAYLYVSTDWARGAGGAGHELRPTLSVIPLTPDATKAAGPRTALFAGRPESWEQAPWAPVVENPWVVKRGATYHLLFSGGSWYGDYGMGHATSSSPDGPFTRTATDPWVRGRNGAHGAGGGMPIADAAGDEWLAYHAWSADDTVRSLRLDRLRWTADELPLLERRGAEAPPAPAR